MTEERQKGDAQQGALKDAEPYLVYTGLGIQKEQLYRSFVLEKGNAFNVEPKKKKKGTVTFLNKFHLPPKSFISSMFCSLAIKWHRGTMSYCT